MSNFGMAIELKGIAEGREQASLKHIKRPDGLYELVCTTGNGRIGNP